MSAQIHKALVKNGMLSKDDERVDTTKIGKKFVSQLYMITSHAQKKLINLLFFWEQEIMRWMVLLGEKDQLKAIIQVEKDTGGNVGTYEKRMMEIDELLRLKPSIRSQAVREAATLRGYMMPPPPPPLVDRGHRVGLYLREVVWRN